MVPHAWACLRFVPTAGLATVQIGTTGSRLNFSCEIPEVVVPALDALVARSWRVPRDARPPAYDFTSLSTVATRTKSM